MHTTNLKSGTLLLLLLLFWGGVRAQIGSGNAIEVRPKLNSPLSRLGLGNPLDQVGVANAGMGAVYNTYQDPFHLNIQNPASLASLAATSFEAGVYARLAELEDNTGSVRTNQGNLRYLALGFPLRNPVNLTLDQLDNSWNAGMAFSIAPTNLVGYDLLLEGADAEFGQTSNVLRGNGGTYRFTWSNAFRYKAFSAGLNLNYNFGKTTNSQVVMFDELPEALASEQLDESSISGLSFGYGVQYVYNFTSPNQEGISVPNGKRILLGVSGELGGGVDAESTSILRRFNPGSLLTARDTISNDEDKQGRVTLPSSFSGGIAFEDINRLYIGVEYGIVHGSGYVNTARPETLLDANRLAFGIQYVPNNSSYNSYWKRVRYRFGVRLEDDTRTIDDVQARRNAITLGAGFPIRLPRQQVSFLDFAVEVGQYGVPDVLDERYVQLTLGFSLNDNSWFFKRKLN